MAITKTFLMLSALALKPPNTMTRAAIPIMRKPLACDMLKPPDVGFAALCWKRSGRSKWPGRGNAPAFMVIAGPLCRMMTGILRKQDSESEETGSGTKDLERTRFREGSWEN